MLLRILLLLLNSMCTLTAYKILIVSPLPGSSHGILGDALVRHLTNAGHEITYITAMSANKQFVNVTTVDVSENMILSKNLDNLVDLTKMFKQKQGILDLIRTFKFLMDVSVKTLSNPNVQQLIADDSKKFDLVIAEWMGSEVYSGFAAVFDCPYIWFSSVEPHWGILRLIDEHPNPSYNADVQTSTIPPFSFLERVFQLGLQTAEVLYKTVFSNVPGFDPGNYRKFIVPAIIKKGKSVPSFEEIVFNASLVLGNSHVSLGIPVRVPENYKHIGGFHIDETVKPLPEDLKKLIESAKHGVIYFSMGTNIKCNTLPSELKQKLIKMFGTLKQTVLWKFEESLPNLPENIHILKWAPQQSILAHPNVVLFITHGGLLSITECIHFGKPIIAIPIFADQFMNVERAVKKGFAKKVDLSLLMAENLRETIQEMIADTRYKEKANELSIIYHDRPVSPGKELIHWVEHVIKTKGALHMRSPALMVPWYQKYYLDLVFVIILLGYCVKYSYRWISGKLRNSQNIKKKLS